MKRGSQSRWLRGLLRWFWAGGARRLSLKDETVEVAGRGAPGRGATRSWEFRPRPVSFFEGRECFGSGGKRARAAVGLETPEVSDVTVPSPRSCRSVLSDKGCSSFQTPARGFLGIFYCFSGLYFHLFSTLFFLISLYLLAFALIFSLCGFFFFFSFLYFMVSFFFFLLFCSFWYKFSLIIRIVFLNVDICCENVPLSTACAESCNFWSAVSTQASLRMFYFPLDFLSDYSSGSGC